MDNFIDFILFTLLVKTLVVTTNLVMKIQNLVMNSRAAKLNPDIKPWYKNMHTNYEQNSVNQPTGHFWKFENEQANQTFHKWPP